MFRVSRTFLFTAISCGSVESLPEYVKSKNSLRHFSSKLHYVTHGGLDVSQLQTT